MVNSLNESLNLRYAGVVYKDTNKRAYSDDAIEQMIYAAAKISDEEEARKQKRLAGVGKAVQKLTK